ncbi:MAG: peptidoglycan glycosyltransferase [Flavobacteriales bacterium]|nr:peptidoglycan glycosyltransferase [Flavobacteriales bacterium]
MSSRKFVVMGIMLSISLAFIGRLFYLQMMENEWQRVASNMTEKSTIIYPPRGKIYDRNGQLMVSNKAIYDLMILGREVKNLDTLALCELLGINKADFILRMDRLRSSRGYSSKKPMPLIKQISPEEFAPIHEQLYKFPGFFGQPRTVRSYKGGIAALVLGDVGEVQTRDLERDEFYRSGDYIGKGGIELAYEEDLRGTKGRKHVLIDPLGRPQKSSEGSNDEAVIKGKDLVSTLDMDLQAYGELLMHNKRGSIVAIEPATGEILALISAPMYDPNMLVGRNRGKNYAQLNADTLLPLYNRAIKGTYRPGSIFKMVQALVALENDKIKPHTRIMCNRNLIGCHGPHTNDDLEGAIIHSCNPYFRSVMKRMVETNGGKQRFSEAKEGMDYWSKEIMQFGFGTNLMTDIGGVKSGTVPDDEYYDKIYGEGRWAFSTIYSISIGEGEMQVNPLQIANLAAIIANKGYYYSPHTVKDIQGQGKRPEFLVPNYAGVDSSYYQTVINAMQQVVEQPGGTARRARTPGITVCGKTGTVQNDPRPDHSVFMAFAPKENPQIAISVYVESAGFGGTWAAPIASLMIEKYMTDSISDPKKEQRILEANFLHVQ